MKSLMRQRGFIGAAIAGSAILGGGAAVYGAQQQRKSAEDATRNTREMFDITRNDLSPYQNAGKMALSELQTRLPELNKPFSLQDFKESPAYQFNLEQGKLALDKASAARGKYYAPSTLQDIAKFSQGLASNEYQNAYSNYNNNMQNIFNRLYSISGSGQNAAAQTGAFGTNAAGQIGQNITGAGNAAAAGTVGAANALTGGVNNLANYQLYQQALSRNQGSTVGGASAGGSYYGGSGDPNAY